MNNSPFTQHRLGNKLFGTRSDLARRLALLAIVAFAAFFAFVRIQNIGDANTYYTAGVASMLQSWKNFFFVAAEPGGAVSIDKPPVGFWLQTAFAYVLGISGFAVVLPEILCGLLSMIVVYHLVRRSFGTLAGLLSAVVMAVTPIFLATERNNTIDSSLILVLLLAAWAFILATETGKFKYLLLGGALIGLGFNIKMLQAYLPLPAFLGLYFLGAKIKLPQKLLHLSLSMIFMIVISLSWVVAVDLTPASERPYVGSSGNNSEFTLAFGYNGLERLTGMGQDFASFVTRMASNTAMNSANTGPGMPPKDDGRAAFGAIADGNASGARPANPPPDGNPPTQNGIGGGPDGGDPGDGGNAGGGFPGTGTAGILRLFIAPLSKQASWLLPFGLLSMLLLIFTSRLRWPLEPKHQAVVLWGGWLVIGAVFFSIAGFFHEYYLSMLAAPLAALVGIGAGEMIRLRTRFPQLGASLLLAMIALTIAFQIATAHQTVGWAWWLTISIVLFVIGTVLVVATLRWNSRQLAVAGVLGVFAAMLVIPGIWTGLTAFADNNNQLPTAFNGGTVKFAQPNIGGNNGKSASSEMLAFLDEHTQGMKYLLAVPSSQQGAEYVLATNRPVLYLGGFNGSDQVLTRDALASLVANRELRYILLGGNGGTPNGSSSISTWVTDSCKVIRGIAGTSSDQVTGNGAGGGSSSKLYDCLAS
jgi:4-amino-4-deoxy-L-arabinose transferase-like glycosyltransferase